jgi:hypothetical protein
MAKTTSNSDAVTTFLDSIDPGSAAVDNSEDLAAIAAIADRLAADEVALTEAVRAARAQGRSWNRIAVALGVSRQAARQRFTELC